MFKGGRRTTDSKGEYINRLRSLLVSGFFLFSFIFFFDLVLLNLELQLRSFMNPLLVLLFLSLTSAAPANVIIRTVVVTAPVQVVTVSANGAGPVPISTASVTTTTSASAKPTTSSSTSTTSSSLSSATSSSSVASSSSSAPASAASSVLSSQSQTGNSFYNTVFKLWQRFWISNKGKWNDDDEICGDGEYSMPVLWNMAVLGKAIANTGDKSGVDVTLERIMDYHDPETGAFFATPNNGEEIYSDDNAQLAWVFIQGYKLTGNKDYLQSAKDIMSYIKTQWGPNGGVIWKKDKNYIASISTIEAALTAVRLYEVDNSDNSLLDFAYDCVNFMFDHLQDPSDHLFYDGTDKNDLSQIDKGKLTYTVGCALSTLAHLLNFKNDKDMLNKALQLAQAATDTEGAFYTDNGLWNNNLEYVHLLFVGFADAFQLSDEFGKFKDEVVRQGNYIYEYLQDPNDQSLYFNLISKSTASTYQRYSKSFAGSFTQDNSIFCSNDPSKPAKKSLLVNASAAQILHAMANF